jgi:hypothetical protein
MKGVTSDVAARSVRDACQQKAAQHNWEKKQAQDKPMIEQYGEDISTNLLSVADAWTERSSSTGSVEITNKSKDKTITYLRLAVTAAGDRCDPITTQQYQYVITLKPGSSTDLVFPKQTKKVCYELTKARARPSKWNDFSISGSAEPVDKDPKDI